MQASVETKSRELLEAALHQGNEFDFVRELAYPLPTMVISSFIGAPTEDIELFKDWSTALSSAQEIGRPAETVTRVNEAVAEAREYLHRLLELRKVAPQEDLISYALGARDETLTDERLVDNCILMLSAGHETTINFLGNAMLALLSDDEAMQRLRRDPSIMPAAVEELLRFDTPVQVTSRVATRDSELSGVEIHEGERVDVLLGAANRDPLQFDNPDRLDFDRQPNQHVAFGHGAHHCLGAPIARLESIVVFETMLDMFESIELAGEPETGGKVMTRGWKQIPIRVSTRNGN
jgi:cytochrome P450